MTRPAREREGGAVVTDRLQVQIPVPLGLLSKAPNPTLLLERLAPDRCNLYVTFGKYDG